MTARASLLPLAVSLALGLGLTIWVWTTLPSHPDDRFMQFMLGLALGETLLCVVGLVAAARVIALQTAGRLPADYRLVDVSLWLQVVRHKTEQRSDEAWLRTVLGDDRKEGESVEDAAVRLITELRALKQGTNPAIFCDEWDRLRSLVEPSLSGNESITAAAARLISELRDEIESQDAAAWDRSR